MINKSEDGRPNFIEGAERIREQTKDRQTAARARAVTAQIVEAYEASYRVAENPLYVWATWRLTRQSNVPCPDWVALALDNWAGNVLALTMRPPKDDVPGAVGRQIGFGSRKNGDNPFSALAKLDQAELLLRQYLQLITAGNAMTSAIAKIAECFKLSANTVRTRLSARVAILGMQLEDIKPGAQLPAAMLALIGQKEVAVRSVFPPD